MKDKKVKLGTQAFLDCIVSGNPVPEVTWFKGNQKLIPSRRLRLSKHLLVIVRFAHDDEGLYSCVAKNRLGYDKQSAHLLVAGQVAPTLQQSDLPHGVFIAIIIVTVISAVVLTSLVWTMLLCYCRKKRREKIELENRELITRYQEDPLLCELPKNYTLHYHGQTVKAADLHNGSNVALLNENVASNSRNHGNEDGVFDVEDDSGIALYYPNRISLSSQVKSSSKSQSPKDSSLNNNHKSLNEESGCTSGLRTFKEINNSGDNGIITQTNYFSYLNTKINRKFLSKNEKTVAVDAYELHHIEYDPTRLKNVSPSSREKRKEYKLSKEKALSQQSEDIPSYVTSSSGIESECSETSETGSLKHEALVIAAPQSIATG